MISSEWTYDPQNESIDDFGSFSYSKEGTYDGSIETVNYVTITRDDKAVTSTEEAREYYLSNIGT